LAGVEPGQEIIAVDGVPTPNWNALSQALLYRLGETGEITLTTKYPDSDFEYESSAPIQSWLRNDDAPDPFKGLGIELYYPGVFAEVGGTSEQTPAAAAGLKQGDRIIAIDGQPLDGWEQMVEIVSASPEKLMDFEIERNGERFIQAIAPEAVEDGGKVIGRIGIYPPAWPEEMLRPYSRSIPEAFVAGVHKTWDTVGFVFMSIKKLIVGEISTKSLSGPFTIAKVAGDSAAAGWIVFVSVLAALSVNLGVLNLLPIPMLDGGHLLFYFIEALKGKPVPERVQIIGHQMGLFLVAGIMVLAFYNDLVRIFTGQLFG
jgi:regulator of sigma E protease